MLNKGMARQRKHNRRNSAQGRQRLEEIDEIVHALVHIWSALFFWRAISSFSSRNEACLCTRINFEQRFCRQGLHSPKLTQESADLT